MKGREPAGPNLFFSEQFQSRGDAQSVSGVPDVVQGVTTLPRGPDLPGRVWRLRLSVRTQQLVGAVEIEAGGSEVFVDLFSGLRIEVPTDNQGNLGSLCDALQVLEKVTALS